MTNIDFILSTFIILLNILIFNLDGIKCILFITGYYL